jgi:transposase
MMNSRRGRQLPYEVVDVVVKLKEHYDNERRLTATVPTRNSAGRTAAALGLGVATVKRIMSKYNRGELIHKTARRPGRPPELSGNIQPAARKFIRERNLRGERATLAGVRDYLHDVTGLDVPKTNLWRALCHWGFTYGEGRRRDSLKERDYVVNARRAYLRRKLANRSRDGKLSRPEIYLDETYINKNHSQRLTWYLEQDGPEVNKPSGVGPRLIIAHAITAQGWVSGASLVFEAKKRSGDYHGQMNWDNFSVWFREQLLPNIPPRSLIVLDNAAYHNVMENKLCPGGSKEQLRAWLDRNNLPWGHDMLKSELLGICAKFAPNPEYRLDMLAREQGHEILRTPPYHPELQPIETCWAVVKNHMADHCDFTMKGLREKLPGAFAKVTSRTCGEIINKVFKEERRYWLEDEKLDRSSDEDFFSAPESDWGAQDENDVRDET